MEKRERTRVPALRNVRGIELENTQTEVERALKDWGVRRLGVMRGATSRSHLPMLQNYRLEKWEWSRRGKLLNLG
jgi:hypothetical protein